MKDSQRTIEYAVDKNMNTEVYIDPDKNELVIAEMTPQQLQEAHRRCMSRVNSTARTLATWEVLYQRIEAECLRRGVAVPAGKRHFSINTHIENLLARVDKDALVHVIDCFNFVINSFEHSVDKAMERKE